MEDIKKWGDPSNGGDDFEMGGEGGWYPFTDYEDYMNSSQRIENESCKSNIQIKAGRIGLFFYS